jgi:hypothetical protein
MNNFRLKNTSVNLLNMLFTDLFIFFINSLRIRPINVDSIEDLAVVSTVFFMLLVCDPNLVLSSGGDCCKTFP